jgi:tetratricopeptide (TPR) repeat protein
LGILAAGLVVSQLLSPTGEAPSGNESEGLKRPKWILVSEFVGPQDDPDLAIGIRELVVSSLTQSGIVTPLSRSDLKRGLELAMKPPTTRIQGDVARELAYRAAARVYVEGRIDRIATGYSIVLNVVDAETGGFVYSVRGIAETGDDMITTLDRITRELREKLGESPEKVAATRPAVDVITPSFPAYQQWIRGIQFHDNGDILAARGKAREALRLDPDFVDAWTLLGWSFLVEGMEDSARYAYDEALRRPDRQTEERYLSTRAMVTSSLDCEFADGLEQWNRLLRGKPSVAWYNNRGVVLSLLGRHEEALESDMLAMEAEPFGPTYVEYANVTDDLIILGRYDEARQMIPTIPNAVSRDRREVYLALAQSDWTRADSIVANGILGAKRPLERELVLASSDASRGSLRTAAGRCALVLDDVNTDFESHFCFWMMHLMTITGRDETLLTTPACGNATLPGLVVRGVQKALAGETREALSVLSAIRQKPDHQQRKYKSDIVVVEASLAAANGEWDKVIRVLGPLTMSGQRPFVTRRLPIRWMVAEAYEKQGLLERAAESYEMVISPVRTHTWDLCVRASYKSLAHYRLALVYSQLDRNEEAKRSWEAFRSMFTEPDPELAPMLEDVRAAVAELERE